MPSSHDLEQDERLAVLETHAAKLHRRINANVRKMKELSDDINARLAKLEKSEHKPVITSSTSSRRKTPAKGVKVR